MKEAENVLKNKFEIKSLKGVRLCNKLDKF